MKDASILSVLADISQPLPATNPETLFSRFTPPRNQVGELCISCFDAMTDGENVVCEECDKHLRGPV